jgi:hypothetical protein
MPCFQLDFRLRLGYSRAEFEVNLAVIMKSAVLLVITPCSSERKNVRRHTDSIFTFEE